MAWFGRYWIASTITPASCRKDVYRDLGLEKNDVSYACWLAAEAGVK